MILCAILHEGRAFSAALGNLSFAVGDFYDDTHQRAFDLFSYVAVGAEAPVLFAVGVEMWNRHERSGMWLDGNFDGIVSAYEWLCDVFGEKMALESGRLHWTAEMDFWAGEPYTGAVPFMTWAGLAAASKVRNLAGRRRKIHRANEMIRDARDLLTGEEE